MSNSTGYGQSFATRLLAQGREAEALVEAEKAVAREPEAPEPVVDRAQVHLAMERFAEGIADLERALVLDRAAPALDDGLFDDLLFTSLLAWAQKVAPRDLAEATRILARYGVILPAGSHAKDAADWTRRLRGELTTTSWTKTR